MLIVRSVLFAVFGLAALRLVSILFWCGVAVCCFRGHKAAFVRRRGRCGSACSALLDYLSTLSPIGNVLVLFFLTFPPVFYERVFLPCWECFDFEAAVAHEAGHVLGFGHPDSTPENNLVPVCAVTNSTCRDPFACASNRPYGEADTSIMHSLTQHAPRACLSSDDLAGLYFLYPLCDSLQPSEVACTKTGRLSGWLRLAIVGGVPFALATVLILMPLTCLRQRERRRMRHLDSALGTAHDQITEYRNALDTVQMMRSTVREAVSRPATALREQANRPGTALNRIANAAGRARPTSRQVHPHPAPGAGRGGKGAGARAGAARNGAAASGATRRAEAPMKLSDVDENGTGTAPPPKPKTRTVRPAGSEAAAPGRGGTRPPARPAAARQQASGATGQTQRESFNGYTGVAWPAKK